MQILIAYMVSERESTAIGKKRNIFQRSMQYVDFPHHFKNYGSSFKPPTLIYF